MDTPEFQRLRYIKQLGLVDMAYPSAVHTRFEHSVGVMHIAGIAVESIRSTGVKIYDREKELIQLAGLLHDIGHIAFSHMLDHKLVEQGFPGHETRSVELLSDINSRLSLLTISEENAVAHMIQGSPPAGGKRSFIYEIVSNSTCGIDVDRLDYLQRDSRHTGMQGFQPDYLIECMCVDQDGHLAFLEKARGEVESMYRARAHMIKTVYRHKTVRKAERTIMWAIKDVQPLSDFVASIYGGWKTLDDYEMTMCLRMLPAYGRLYTRDWVSEEEFGEKDKDYTSLLTDAEIYSEIEKVRFV